MKKLFIILSLALLFGSCASLTKTQIDSVNQFAQTSKDFSDYPSKIMTELAALRVKRGVYFSNSLDDPQQHIDDLDGIYGGYKSDYEVSAKVDITFKVIDKYAQALLLLSSDKHTSDLEKQAKNFGVDLDSLITLYNSVGGVTQIPKGIGGAINQLIVLGGKQYIKTKQAKEIKKFVPQADSLIAVMTKNLLDFLESTTIQTLIDNEKRGIKSNYKSFLNQRKPTIENERDYLALNTSIDAIEKLRLQTIAATKNLRKAHKKMLAEIQEKKKIKETLKELQELYEEVKEIKNTINDIESSKN